MRKLWLGLFVVGMMAGSAFASVECGWVEDSAQCCPICPECESCNSCCPAPVVCPEQVVCPTCYTTCDPKLICPDTVPSNLQAIPPRIKLCRRRRRLLPDGTSLLRNCDVIITPLPAAQ